MAEIKIERKKPVWPWILLILIVIGSLIYFFVFSEKNETAPYSNGLSPETEIPEANDSINHNYADTLNR